MEDTKAQRPDIGRQSIMNSRHSPSSFAFLFCFGLLAIPVFIQSANGQSPVPPTAPSAYQQGLQELDRLNSEVKDELDRDRIIEAMRKFLAAFPTGPENIRVEMMIAGNFERGGPKFHLDLGKAVDQYVYIISHYAPSDPQVKQAMVYAAERSIDPRPEQSKSLVKQMLDAYPDDDLIKLYSYWFLGTIAMNANDADSSEKYFAEALHYRIQSNEDAKRRREMARLMQNSSNDLMGLAISSSGDPLKRMIAFKNMTEKYP